jgi:hypothetical protein
MTVRVYRKGRWRCSEIESPKKSIELRWQLWKAGLNNDSGRPFVLRLCQSQRWGGETLYWPSTGRNRSLSTFIFRHFLSTGRFSFTIFKPKLKIRWKWNFPLVFPMKLIFFNCCHFILIWIPLVRVCILTSYIIRVYAKIKYVVRRLIFVDSDPYF